MTGQLGRIRSFIGSFLRVNAVLKCQELSLVLVLLKTVTCKMETIGRLQTLFTHIKTLLTQIWTLRNLLGGDLGVFVSGCQNKNDVFYQNQYNDNEWYK